MDEHCVEGIQMPSRTYVDQTIVLDGKCFHDVTFISCTLIYTGIEGVALSGCRFINPKFVFEGPAANMLALLRGMYLDGCGEIVDASLKTQNGGSNPTRH